MQRLAKSASPEALFFMLRRNTKLVKVNLWNSELNCLLINYAIPDLSDTQPAWIEPSTEKRKGENSAFREMLNKIPWKWVGILGVVLLIVVSSGAWIGWSSARRSQLDQQASQTNLTLDQQYDLGLEDLFQALRCCDPALRIYPFPGSGLSGVNRQAGRSDGRPLFDRHTHPPAPTATPTHGQIRDQSRNYFNLHSSWQPARIGQGRSSR